MHSNNKIFNIITTLGHPIFYILVVLILFSFDAPFAIVLLSSLIFIEMFCIFIKLIHHKERPNPQTRNNLFEKIDANSFPSVHSARISLMATMLVLHYENIFLFALSIILIILVGYSRIYLKKHYLKDVIAGYSIGVITAIIISYFIL